MSQEREILVQYADLKEKQKQIDEQVKLLQPEALAAVQKIRGSKDAPVVLDGRGKYSIVKRKKWSYTDTVVSLEKQWKERKAKEEAEGLATFDVQETLQFKADEL